MNNPFKDSQGNIVFPFQATRDVCFVFPHELPDDIRGILIPDKFKEDHQYSAGIILSIGEGYYKKKDGSFVPTTGKVGDYILFDSSITVINWKVKVKSPIDGKEYITIYLGERDCQGVIENENT